MIAHTLTPDSRGFPDAELHRRMLEALALLGDAGEVFVPDEEPLEEPAPDTEAPEPVRAR